MSNRFYFDDDDESSTSSTDLSSLPYPKPLTRAAFLVPDFDPTTFLSSLHGRHQTLEDLRQELRQRSTDLNKELLDLVNSKYEDFLGLGRDLKGGDEKVEEVRLGVLGFRREVEGLKRKVRERREEVERLVEEKRKIRERVVLGRGLLEVDRRITALEKKLMLVSKATKDEEEEDEGSDSDEENSEELAGVVEIGKPCRHAAQYVYITKLVQKLGPEHPFLESQEERIQRLRQTILLDLGTALKQAAAAGEDGQLAILKALGVYKAMNESKEAIRVLKETKSQKPRV